MRRQHAIISDTAIQLEEPHNMLASRCLPTIGLCVAKLGWAVLFAWLHCFQWRFSKNNFPTSRSFTAVP